MRSKKAAGLLRNLMFRNLQSAAALSRSISLNLKRKLIKSSLDKMCVGREVTARKIIPTFVEPASESKRHSSDTIEVHFWT